MVINHRCGEGGNSMGLPKVGHARLTWYCYDKTVDITSKELQNSNHLDSSETFDIRFHLGKY